MFSSEAQLLETTSFAADVQKRLQELEMAGFDETEMVSFRRVLMLSAEQFDQETWDVYDGKRECIPFLTSDVELVYGNPNDVWQFALDSRSITIGI